MLNFAVAKTKDSDADITANAESVGLLMTRYASAKAFLHCSSTAVYAPQGGVGPDRGPARSATTTTPR